jgi:hypothetical protein
MVQTVNLGSTERCKSMFLFANNATYMVLSRVQSDYRRLLDLWPDLLDAYATRYYTSYVTIINTHTLASTVTSSLLLLGRGFQRRTFLFLWASELSSASVTGF